ncbi:MAG: LysR family transcriptional regulator [Duodenibacillus sp.]|nr:LysR family transcriptional regulator [Duodenibacillus sp.]
MPSPLDHLENWRVFCAVARTGSLQAACAELGLEPSFASRVIKRLEAALGAPLFVRSSRPMRLTEAARLALPRAERLLEARAEISAVAAQPGAPDAIVIAAHPGASQTLLMGELVEYQRSRPEVQFELQDLRLSGPGRPAADMTLCYADDGGIARDAVRLECGTAAFVACASPLYVRKRGAPESPAGCASHAGVLLRTPGRSSVTRLHNARGASGRLAWKQAITAASLPAAKSAVLLGAGICPDMALIQCAQELEQGMLVAVMPEWRRPPLPALLAVAPAAWESPAKRAFAQWLAGRLRGRFAAMEERFPWCF